MQRGALPLLKLVEAHPDRGTRKREHSGEILDDATRELSRCGTDLDRLPVGSLDMIRVPSFNDPGTGSLTCVKEIANRHLADRRVVRCDSRAPPRGDLLDDFVGGPLRSVIWKAVRSDARDEVEDLIVADFTTEAPSVAVEKGESADESSPLVPVVERMILHERMEEGTRLVRQGPVFLMITD